MKLRRPVRIENADQSAGLHGEAEIVQECEWLRDLVIHMDEQSGIDRIWRQARIVRLAARDHHIGKSRFKDARVQHAQIIRRHVLREYAAVGTEQLRKPYRVIARARADIGDVIPGFQIYQREDLLGFLRGIAVGLGVENRADDFGDRPARLRKDGGGQAGRAEECLLASSLVLARRRRPSSQP